MKNHKVFFLAFLILSQGAYAGTVAHNPGSDSDSDAPAAPASTPTASPAPTPLSDPSPTASPVAITLTPDTLRDQLLLDNNSILATLNQVYEAKGQVYDARANLLPQVSVTGLMNITSGPSFVLSTISFLVPFVFPSNWFDLFAADDEYEAEKISYRIMELNTYGSALSMYFTLQSDYQGMKLYQHQADVSNQMLQIAQEELSIGSIAEADFNTVQAQAALAQSQADALAQIYAKDFASMREALGLPITAEITLPDLDQTPIVLPAETAIESIDPTDATAIQNLVTTIDNNSPEYNQLQDLIAAAKEEQLSAAFAFLNASTISAGSSSGSTTTSASFGNLHASGSATIGFGIFTSYALSNDSLTDIQIQEQALELGNTDIVEAGVKSIQDALQQLTLAQAAEDAAASTFTQQQTLYRIGAINDMDLLMSDAAQTTAVAARIAAQLNINQLRVTLHRLMLDDDLFGQIKGCDPTQLRNGPMPGFWDWMLSLVGLGTDGKATVDQICREGGSIPSLPN